MSRVISGTLRRIGFDASALRAAVVGLVPYLANLRAFRRELSKAPQLKGSGSRFQIKPCFGDRSSAAGVSSGHYFHQDLLVAQRIFSRQPLKHVDIGSRIDGFVAHVATFREIEVFDLRPLAVIAPNITFKQQDICSPRFAITNYCDSVSCLHALEHFGLGRYGDEVDAAGHIRGLQSITQLLQPGGLLYLSVPIGPPRIEFDAQRVFSIEQVLALLRNAFVIESIAYVDDEGQLHANALLEPDAIASNFGCWYGCAVVEARKV